MKTDFGRGLVAFSQGRYEDAFTFFQESHKKNIPPDKHLTHYNMGLSLFFLENFTRAKNYFFEALRYMPNHSDTLHWVAYIYFREGKLFIAESHYLNSVKVYTRL